MKDLKLWLWGVKQAKADTGLRSSSSVELVAHLGRMLRAHLGGTPTCRAQRWEQLQPGCPVPGDEILFVS